MDCRWGGSLLEPQVNFEQLSILLALSNQQAAEAYVPILRSCGVKRVVSVASNTEALSHLQANSFNMVVTDDNLPDLGGYDFCRFLRLTNISASLAPIVFGLHTPDQKSVIKARDMGASKIVVMPLTGNNLQTAILQATQDLRPIVQCSAYNGPDRRRKNNPAYKGPNRRKTSPDIVSVAQQVKALF